MEINKIYNEDCMVGMRMIDDESCDAVITDPPFNISVKNNFHTLKGRKGIDFGEWDKDFDLVSWLEIALKKLTSGGNIIIFSAWRNMGQISDFLESNDCLIKELVMWNKSNPMPRNRDRLYVTSCEFALWATKGKGWTFNRQRNTYENTIFTYPIVNKKERIHPTQKPVKLMEDIIKIHTKENDLILDPFIGSGTTALAAMNTNRNFIGFEIDKRYFDLSIERISELKNKI